MCTVSDKIKLCSCKTDATRLRHYWVLNRVDHTDTLTLGDIVCPPRLSDHTHKLNKKLLLQLLNNGNCFDVEMQHQEGNILELHFTCQDPFSREDAPLTYAFIYKNGKWKTTKYDPFGD